MPLFIGVFQGAPGYRKNPFLVSRSSLGTIAPNEKRETRNGFTPPCALPPLNCPPSPFAAERMQSRDEYDSIGNNFSIHGQPGIQISQRHPGRQPARPGMANDLQRSGLNRS